MGEGCGCCFGGGELQCYPEPQKHPQLQLASDQTGGPSPTLVQLSEGLGCCSMQRGS